MATRRHLLTYKRAYGSPDRQTDRRTGRQTEGHPERQIDRRKQGETIEKLRNLGATLHDSQHSLTGTGTVWMPSHLGCFLEVSSTTRTLLRTFKNKIASSENILLSSTNRDFVFLSGIQRWQGNSYTSPAFLSSKVTCK